jgi:hypothetical protein
MVAAVTRGLRWLLASVAALLVAWLVAPAVVPIYDGAGFPDEPYRYVQSPDGKPTKPPTDAKATVQVNAQGLSSAAYSNSAERGPQIVLYLPAGSLKAPAGATSIQVSETPLAATPPLPADGTIVTNVYRVAATTTSAGPVQVVGKSENQLPTLQMRAPSAQQPGPVVERRTSSGWQRMDTLRVGQDIYQASAPQFGDWALVQVRTPVSKKSSGGGGGVNVGLLAAGIGLLALAGIILAIRIARSRSS